MAQRLLLYYCMNICMLENMLAGNVGTKPTPLKPFSAPPPKHPASIPAGDAPSTDTNQTVTTDNSQLVAQDKPPITSSDNFSDALDKKIATQTSPNAQLAQLKNEKGKKTDLNSGTLSNVIHPAIVIHPAMPLMIQGTQTQPAVLDKAIGAKVDNLLEQQIKSQAQNKSAWLLPDSKTSQSSSLIVQLAKPTTKPDQIAPETAGLENKPIQPMTTSAPQGPIISKSTLPGIANESPILNAGPQKESDTGKTPETNTVVTSAPKTITSQELTSETHTSGSKDSINSEPSAGTNKPLNTENPKTLLLNTPFAAAVELSPNSQQKVLTSQSGPNQSAEQTAPNKTDTTQKNLHNKLEQLLELPENRFQTENLSVKSITQKISQPQVQPSAQQTENRTDLLTNQLANPDMESGKQSLFGNNVQPAAAEQSPASAESTKISGNTNSVGSQIQESIHTSFQSGNQQIIVRLNPPELGKVAIKFTEQGDDVTGLLQVDKLQTREQIQQALPEIIQNLQNSGIQIKRLEVTLTNQQEQYTTLKDQSSTAGQDGFYEQQTLPHPESQENNTIYTESLTNTDNAFEYMEPQMQFTDSSINMLV